MTGLAAAHRLQELIPTARISLFERSLRVGGILHTVRRDGFLIERSADNFLTKDPTALDLCNQLGLARDLQPTDPARRRAFVIRGGRVVPVPSGFVIMSPGAVWPILSTPLLSPWGKLRVMMEWLIPRNRELANEDSDESVASFCRRRLGAEAFQRLVQPLIGGIYTADPERLSMRATLPHLIEQEQRDGSLWRGARRSARDSRALENERESGARYGLFLAPQQGMQALTDRLAAALPAGTISTGIEVTSLRPMPSGGAWGVSTSGSPEACFEGAVLAVPAGAAAKLTAGFDPALSGLLGGIEYAGATIVCLGYRREQTSRPIDGFGVVIPHVEGRHALAVSFASHKFPGRAPEGCELARVFFGGALQPETGELPDSELIRLAVQELRSFVGLQGEPLLVEIARWGGCMPQYHIGHQQRVGEIERLVAGHGGLVLAGAAYRGVGVPQCIASGREAAQSLANYLAAAQPVA